ncbi:MAG: ATP-dependent sacrificial sulfur transferase LarE [Kiritimatiellia bacterium]|nr:ATP-dependent sacrificial sulfur transferase LarE [Kiritimatiellia bacterium]
MANEKNESGLAGRRQALRELLARMESVAIAFSGGVDSSYLLAEAAGVPGLHVLALTADSPSLPTEDRLQAVALAKRLNVEHRFVRTAEMENPLYIANGPDRCYHCKSALFTELMDVAGREKIRFVLYGANADDQSDYRPGHRAAEECGIRAPLAELGFTKKEIREALRDMGLAVAEKPAAACLSSRIPYGTPISATLLDRVDRAESALRALGFSGCRVRAHGDVARLEVPPDAIEHAAGPIRLKIVEVVRQAGFRYVALDLAGYRTGSLNEVL